jgi:hypothetical protein
VEELRTSFNERLSEVETYLEFLKVLETRAQTAPPKIEGADHPISAQQQRILYSSVYLQLYNLVESTMTRCIDAVGKAASQAGTRVPGDLSVDLRREWVRVVARTHTEHNAGNRLERALVLCEHLVAALPIAPDFEIEKGGGGNWDDHAIEDFTERLGVAWDVNAPVSRAVKRHVRDELGSLQLVKNLRNRLAHGSISFTECAEDVVVAEMIVLKDRTADYMRAVVERFIAYLSTHEFLVEARRPAVVAA